jgi:hypothetical protein
MKLNNEKNEQKGVDFTCNIAKLQAAGNGCISHGRTSIIKEITQA